MPPARRRSNRSSRLTGPGRSVPSYTSTGNDRLPADAAPCRHVDGPPFELPDPPPRVPRHNIPATHVSPSRPSLIETRTSHLSFVDLSGRKSVPFGVSLPAIRSSTRARFVPANLRSRFACVRIVTASPLTVHRRSNPSTSSLTAHCRSPEMDGHDGIRTSVAPFVAPCFESHAFRSARLAVARRAFTGTMGFEPRTK